MESTHPQGMLAGAESVARGRRLPRWAESLLRIPLVGKIAGANAAIVLAALVATWAVEGNDPHRVSVLAVLATALAVSIVVNVFLVLVALSPLDALESTAQRIWQGELDARVPSSAFADADLRRVGSAINALLDGLAMDRVRLRRTAAQAIEVGDRERARLAEELHDSVAQTLAAVLMEMSVVARENRDAPLQPRLEHVRRLTSDVLDEVKQLAHVAHPRVIDDLGLRPAFEQLVRDTAARTSAQVSSTVDESVEHIPAVFNAVLYRIAQQAVDNAVRHASARAITLRMRVVLGNAQLEVTDDGTGFDVTEAERARAASGLFAIRERASLLGGVTDIQSRPGAGTTITVRIPLDAAVALSAPATTVVTPSTLGSIT